MDTAFKINAMCLDATESFLLLGTNSGELLYVDTESLTVLGRTQANVGSIYAVAMHPSQPWAATLGMDCMVCLWDIRDIRSPRLVSRYNMRSVSPWNDLNPVPIHPSHSQALCFHPELPRIATRSGNAGVAELEYESGELELRHCTRMHGPEDVTTVRYLLDGAKLASGGLGSVVLSEEGLVINSWRIGDHNVHWFEPLGNEEYLIATDDRRVVRFDFKKDGPTAIGPLITLDDLEHVTFNGTSGRAYVAGFDRNVYEIDPADGSSLGIAYAAPFKMRWIKTLRKQPDTAILQCFDGGVYKVDLRRRQAVAALRQTPPAIWTACDLGKGRLALTGEGDEIVTLEYAYAGGTRLPVCRKADVARKGETGAVTKRMQRDADGSLWLGQSSGTLIQCRRPGSRTVARLGSPIRDLAFDNSGKRVLACLENGTFHSIDKASGASLAQWHSDQDLPLWAMAVHPHLNMVAVGERRGRLVFLDTDTADVLRMGPQAERLRVKRAKWLNTDVMLYGFGESMRWYDWRLDEDLPFVEACRNTIEDFIWSEVHGYLVCVTYNTDIVLCDLDSGEKIHMCSDQGDFSKGLAWLPPTEEGAYPLDFVTYGRSGTAHLYRVKDNKIYPLGPCAPQLLTERYRVDGQTYEQLMPRPAHAPVLAEATA